jgi:hypothetical protein
MSKPVYFKLGSTGKIYQADICRDYTVGVDWSAMIQVVEFDDISQVHQDIFSHTYFNRNYANVRASLYLILKGDLLYESIKDTRLARKMYPDAIEHEGWLLIES